MKNILFVGLFDSSKKTDGVSLKCLAQIEALKKIGFKVHQVSYHAQTTLATNSTNQKIFIEKRGRKYVFKLAINYIKHHPIDGIYLRFPHISSQVISFLKIAKNRGIKIVMEIPSYPIDYSNDNFKSFLYRLGDFFFTPLLKKYLSLIYSIGEPVSTIFGVPNISIPNGYLSTVELNITRRFNNNIELICVSNFYFIHGIDRLIEGLHLYHTNNPVLDYPINLHLIGDGPLKKHYEKWVDKIKLNNHIIFHGIKEGQKLSDLYNFCNLGCGSLGLHRYHKIFSSPLKTKDYFQYGLPLIIAYEEIGIDKPSPYIFKVPSNDTPIDFNGIISFYKKIQHLSNSESISSSIQKLGKAIFLWENILVSIKQVI